MKYFEIFSDSIKRRAGSLVMIALWLIISFAVFYLYELPFEAFFYALILSAFAIALWLAAAFIKDVKAYGRRESFLFGDNQPTENARSLAERDYINEITRLRTELAKVRTEYDERARSDEDYYTAWVHQIKTPIAVLRLEAASGDSEIINNELFRIEQYADMVLQYIRLGSSTNDLVINEIALDGVIRESIRKFAPQFISAGDRMIYEGTDIKIITDRKWFSCILDQLLSNAVKYTKRGTIEIKVTESSVAISDTGIGIAREDLPRIFEKGYTGINGRSEKRASGLGLYLCRRAAELIHTPVTAQSEIGKGSTFSIDISEAHQ